IGTNPYDHIHDQLADARRLLTGLGLYEAQGQTLVSDRAAVLASSVSPISLANPLSSDMNVLRPSLLPGLLDALRHNINHKSHDLALFEIGRVFPVGREERRMGIALTGRRHPGFWSGEDREATFDVYDLKGMIEE